MTQTPVRNDTLRGVLDGMVRGVSRRPWQGDKQQLDKLRAAVKAVRKWRDSERKAWDAVQMARKVGIPDEVIAADAGIARSTINRRLGSRARPVPE
jgi:hypothetical protein